MNNRFFSCFGLKTKRDFDNVFTKNTKRHTQFFVVYQSDNGLDNARLGVVISKRACKRAVDRNAARRVARESFRHIVRELPARDYVICARYSVANASKRELRQCLDQLWQKSANR